MFYVNNKQVLGMFLNGKNYNYIAYGFSKIIPEDRNARFAYINLAGRYLNLYRVEYGNIKSGYDNFPIARLDYPVNGIFHSPLTYYYGDHIVPTKNVPVVINNGYCAIRGPVYNDININGNIVYFAANSNFQDHNVKIHVESDSSTSPSFNGTVMDNCRNFRLNAVSHFSKSGSVALYNCRNFSGNFEYWNVGANTTFAGFRGFLHTCRDGSFNFKLWNMHGGGSDASVTNYYNFSCISNCNNINLNITGSSWQAWVHPSCYSNNCNITTGSIVPGFDCMNYCNFDIHLPSNANVEKSAYYSLLSNSSNCNVYLDGVNSNLYSFRNGDLNSFLFQDLNDCNLNLLMNNSTGLDYAFGNRLNNCNIYFDNLNFKQQGFGFMNNCTLTGTVNHANIWAALVYSSRNVNLNIDALSTHDMILVWNVDGVTGNVNLSNDTNIKSCSNSILNLYNGNAVFSAVDSCKFRLDNVNNVTIQGAYNTNFNLFNCDGKSYLSHLDNVKFIDRPYKSNITNLDNCFNSYIYARTVGGLVTGLIENVYNTYLRLKEITDYKTVNVYNCDMDGFPNYESYHTEDCTFRTSLEIAQIRFSSYVTWSNVWPHATRRGSGYSTNAGLESTANLTRCYLNNNNASIVNGSHISFYNNGNMIMNLLTFYSGTVDVALPNYATNIKLNVDCHNLNLGVFMAGPPHGLEYSSISADNIFCTTGNNYFVQMDYGTRIYCENFCNVPFVPIWRRFSDNYQPVLLINNYQQSNSEACIFNGGIVRIGRLNYMGGAPANMYLANGACIFINNATLSDTTVDNALLFLGTNVYLSGGGSGLTVTNGGMVVNKANYSMSAISKFVNRKNFAWNFQDSGPWGWRSLLNFCIDV